MNSTIEWLCREQLQVDDEWSVRTPNGFTWWAYTHAQTVAVEGEAVGPDGVGHYISIRTAFLRDLELTDANVAVLNDRVMRSPSLAGPVYDPVKRTLDLCSLARVSGDNKAWMHPLLSVAAVLQLAEARALAPSLAATLGAKSATSGHPRRGVRDVPDEMAGAVESLIAPLGNAACRWKESEFEETLRTYMRRPPALLASGGGTGCTIEFPYGDESSLCQLNGGDRHARYGNGLWLLQTFPVPDKSQAAGVRLALSLNAHELAAHTEGYGFGSYSFRDGMLRFSTFVPNAAYATSVLPNLYIAAGIRAHDIAVRVTRQEWTSSTFKPEQSGLGRLWDRLRGKAPSRTVSTPPATPPATAPPAIDTAALLEQAAVLLQERKYESAEALLRKVTAVEPQNWNALYLTGQCRRFRGDFHGAIELFQKAIDLQNDQSPVFQALGIAYQLAECWDEAIAALQRAIELEPDNELAYNSLGVTQRKMGAYEEALQSYDAGATALTRRLAKTLHNTRASQVAEGRPANALFWTEYALAGAKALMPFGAGSGRIARLTPEKAEQEERTHAHEGLYWIDVPSVQRGDVRVLLPNYFHTMRALLELDLAYADLIGNRGTVLDLLGRSDEAHQHFDEASEFAEAVRKRAGAAAGSAVSPASNDRATLSIFDDPDDLPIESVPWTSLATVVAGGIVNPFGPTLIAVALEGKLKQGSELPVWVIMLNPFRQTAKRVGLFRADVDQVQMFDAVIPLVTTWFGGCPTLLMPSALQAEADTGGFVAKLLQQFDDGVNTLEGTRRHPRNPWSRIQAEVDGMAGGARDQASRSSRLTDSEARELAKNLLDPASQTVEFQAFMDAWNGAIEFQGSSPMAAGAMAFPAFVELLERIATTCRVPWLTGTKHM